MSGSDSNTIIPQEELRAALAEIQKMSREEAQAIPSLDDGHGSEYDGFAAEAGAFEPASTQPSLDETPDLDSGEFAEQEAQVDAVLDQLEALAAKLEAVTRDEPEPSISAEKMSGPEASESSDSEPSPESEPPSSEADTTAEVASEPTDAEKPGEQEPAVADLQPVEDDADRASATEEPQGTADNEPVAQPKPEQAPQPTEVQDTAPEEEIGAERTPPTKKRLKNIRFKIGKETATEDVAGYQPPDGSAAGAASAVATPVTPLSKRIYRAIDRGLDAVNRPFVNLSEGVRSMIGWLALTTLIVSVLAIVVLPIVLPHRDAISFLHEKHARLDAEATDHASTEQTPEQENDATSQ